MCPRRSAPERAERLIRRLLLVAALLLAAFSLAATLIPAWLDVPARAAGAISWRPTAIGAAVLVGLLLWGMGGAWAMLGIGIALLEVPALAASPSSLAVLATLSQTLLIGLVLAFTGTIVLRLSRSADAASADRELAATAAAGAAGAAAARARAAALVHDEVLSTLNLAASPQLVDRQLLAEQAARTRERLESASSDRGADSEEQASRDATIETLRADVLALDAAAEFAVRGDTHAAPAPPAVREAMRHALGNSLRHAGPAAQRWVTVEFDAEAMRVVVQDDGSGFNPSRVATRRLGLRAAAEALRAEGYEQRVHSAPGAGTRVTIEGAGPPAARDAERLPSLGETPLVRAAVAVTTIAFAVTQTMLATVAVVTAGATQTAMVRWLPLIVLGLLCAGALLLLRGYTRQVGGTRTVLVLAVTAAAITVGLVSAPFEIGHLWFAGAAAFLFTALAFRGRPVAAAAGGALLSIALVVAGMANGAPPLLTSAVAVRPLGVTAFAVGLTFAVDALLRRIARDLAAAEAEAAQESWERSSRTEQAERVREVLNLVDEVLSEIALGRPLDAQTCARAQALEGQLRDRIRAGRLAREPLLTAAARARKRGVDVLLIDDLEGELPEHFDLEEAFARLARACDAATSRVAARVLPPGRSTVISIVVDGSPSSTSFCAKSQNLN